MIVPPGYKLQIVPEIAAALPADAKLLEARRFMEAEICRVFAVKPEQIGLSHIPRPTTETR